MHPEYTEYDVSVPEVLPIIQAINARYANSGERLIDKHGCSRLEFCRSDRIDWRPGIIIFLSSIPPESREQLLWQTAVLFFSEAKSSDSV